MAKLSIKPLGDRVLIEPAGSEYGEGRTASGIVIPDTAEKERPQEGKVVAVGEGKRKEDGDYMSLSIKRGQRVLFTKYGPNEIKVDGKEYLIAREDDILAIID